MQPSEAVWFSNKAFRKGICGLGLHDQTLLPGLNLEPRSGPRQLRPLETRFVIFSTGGGVSSPVLALTVLLLWFLRLSARRANPEMTYGSDQANKQSANVGGWN